MFRLIGKIVIGKNEKKIGEFLKYADIKMEPYSFVGLQFTISILLSLAVSYFIKLKYGPLYGLGAFLFTNFLYYAIVTSVLSLMADSRARYAESVLPDLLLIMASNLRSGVPTDEAFMLSARPEFGFIAERMRRAGSQLATGADFGEAVEIITENLNSRLLKRTLKFITEGVKSGGELASILETTAMDIRDNAMIKKEIASMLVIYATFTIMAIALIAPVLYAVSVQLSTILSSMSKSLAFEFLSERAVATKLKPPTIEPEFLVTFTTINLIITSAFGSLMLGLINKGSEKEGLRYMPIIVLVSLLVYYGVSYLLSGFFGTIKVA